MFLNTDEYGVKEEILQTLNSWNWRNPKKKNGLRAESCFFFFHVFRNKIKKKKKIWTFTKWKILASFVKFSFLSITAMCQLKMKHWIMWLVKFPEFLSVLPFVAVLHYHVTFILIFSLPCSSSNSKMALCFFLLSIFVLG